MLALLKVCFINVSSFRNANSDSSVITYWTRGLNYFNLELVLYPKFLDMYIRSHRINTPSENYIRRLFDRFISVTNVVSFTITKHGNAHNDFLFYLSFDDFKYKFIKIVITSFLVKTKQLSSGVCGMFKKNSPWLCKSIALSTAKWHRRNR